MLGVNIKANFKKETHICHTELVSASPILARRFRTKFGMISIATLLICFICAFTPANLIAQEIIITSFEQTGMTSATCLINGGAFTGASISGDIILADGLDIPNFAFALNPHITSVTAAGNIGNIGDHAFSESSCAITFNNVTTIGENAFFHSSGDITFNNVTSIGTGAFWQSLGAITFNTVTNISAFAFRNSSGAITFNRVTSINGFAFDGSSGVLTFNMITVINSNAFINCLSEKIYVSNEMPKAQIKRFAIEGFTGNVEKLPAK
ncbi:MAG: leucine-rich repeat domain-containing protein [Bacteroidetes bacterium]|nr:leucine-rich repeat domain-containing protein [Bacteroidota bacterium]